ncbi:unnamed protein product, partial [Didymodactylos carnosus]
ELSIPTDKRPFILATALHQGYTVERLWELTKIDRWFLYKFSHIIQFIIERMEKSSASILENRDFLLDAKRLGFSDKQIGYYCNDTEVDVRSSREKYNIHQYVKQIDTVAGEFPAQTNYLYLTYHGSENDVQPSSLNQNKPTIVLGSGVYRIG